MSEDVDPSASALVRATSESPRLKALLEELKDSSGSSKTMENLILDPSVFAYNEAFSSVLESELVERYRVLVPTLIYESVRSQRYERFAAAIGSWEGRKREELEKVWKELMEQSERILKVFVPIGEVLEELSSEQRSTLAKLDKVLSASEQPFRERNMISIEMAVEIIRIACVTSVILSVSEKARKWYGKLKGSIIQKAEDNQTLMKVKRTYRETMRKAGWKGTIVIWIAKLVPLPLSPAAGIAVNVTIDIVLIVLADGTHRCQFCGRSLWKIPRDIKFCPYCSNPLTP